MRKHILYIILFQCFAIISIAQTPRIYFTENKNQWPKQVLFRAPLYDGYLYAEKNCLTYYFFDNQNDKHDHAGNNVSFSETKEEIQKKLHDYDSTKQFKRDTSQLIKSEKIVHKDFKAHSYKVYFTDMNKNVEITKDGDIPGVENYYIGNDPNKWAQGVKSFKKIKYNNIYNGIDLLMYDNNGCLKYDYIVHKGGNAKKIKMQYSGVNRMEINQEGAVIIFTSVNQVYEQKPYAYQIINGDTIVINCKYKLDHFLLSYEVEDYNHNYELYIDPQLIFSTYSGSFADSWGFTATYDGENNVYAGGAADGVGFPVSIGAFQTAYSGGNWDISILKLDPTGKNRIYATYLGGNSSEMPHSLIANSNNELLILGTTGSNDFPMANSYDNTFNGGPSLTYDNAIEFLNGVDMFVARLSADGTQLLSSTFLGGTGNDGINFENEWNSYYGQDSLYFNYGDGARGEIMVDQDDNVYIASTTFSSDFPTISASQATFGGVQDGIVCKFNPSLSSLQWSTYFGGESKDATYSIDVDKSGFAYVTGGTCSQTNPYVFNGFIPNRIGGTVDAFVVKMQQSDGLFTNATYFGSNAYDQAHFVRINNEGNVFIFGQTMATGSTLVFNAPYNNPNSGQFLASFSNDLSVLNWSTVFGSGMGRPNLSPTAFEVDICNRIYLAGSGRDWPPGGTGNWYYDNHFGYFRYDQYGWPSMQGTKNMDITADAYQSYTDGQDYYIMVIDDEAKNLDYATYFGEINYGGWVSYDGVNSVLIPCSYSGHDHVDGGTSRFDSKGYIYQSVCSSCGGCQGFPTFPKPGAWSNTNNAGNCNNAVMRFFIDFGLLIADFELPEIGCKTKELEFINKTQIYYNDPKIKYTWDFGDGSPVSNDENPKHIYDLPGEYTIKLLVEDSSACNMKDSITKKLEIVNDIKYDTLPPQHICEGDTAIVGISNPYDPLLIYEWTPIDGLDSIDRPSSHAFPDTTTNYTLTVTSGWCQTVNSQTVNVYNNSYRITDIEVKVGPTNKNPICKGEKATLTAITSAPTQRYIWSTSRDFWPILNADFTQSSIDVNPLDTTTYYVHVLSEFCDFEDIDSVTIIVSSNSILATGDTLICKGDVASLLVVNNTPEYPVEYSWVPKFSIAFDDLTDNPIVRPQITTEYIVYATNAVGCVASDTVKVKVDVLEIDTYVNNPISCFGQTDAAISIAPIGIFPFTYVWEDASILPDRSNLGAGTYTVTVTDSLGCVNTRDFPIIEPKLLQIIDTTLVFVTCSTACNGAISVEVEGGTKPYSHLWSNGDTLSSIQNICLGNYSYSVTDAHGCTASISNPIQIGIFEKLPALFAKADNPILFKGLSTRLIAIEPPQDSVTYHWSPNIWMDRSDSSVVVVNPEESFTYYVRAIDKYGCMQKDTVTLAVYEWICGDPFIYVPTAFTPNDDGKNDLFKVESGVVTELYFAIYDRWGEKLFETTDVDKTWDGKYMNKPVQPQVLVYYIEATCFNKEKYTKKGNITLIK